MWERERGYLHDGDHMTTSEKVLVSIWPFIEMCISIQGVRWWWIRIRSFNKATWEYRDWVMQRLINKTCNVRGRTKISRDTFAVTLSLPLPRLVPYWLLSLLASIRTPRCVPWPVFEIKTVRFTNRSDKLRTAGAISTRAWRLNDPTHTKVDKQRGER